MTLVANVCHAGLTFCHTGLFCRGSVLERIGSSLMLPHIDISAVRYKPLIIHCDCNYTAVSVEATRQNARDYYYHPKIADHRIFAIYLIIQVGYSDVIGYTVLAVEWHAKFTWICWKLEDVRPTCDNQHTNSRFSSLVSDRGFGRFSTRLDLIIFIISPTSGIDKRTRE